MVGAEPERRAAEVLTPPRHVLVAGLRLTAAGVLVATEHDGRLVVTWTTPAVDRLLGVALGEAVGLDLDVVVVREIDHDPDEPRSLTEIVIEGTGLIDVSLRHGDGPPVAVRVAATRVEDDHQASWVVTLEEIDEQVRADARLRESEERFRTLAAQAPIGIVVSDVGLRLGFVNDRALQLWDQSIEVMRSPRWIEAIVPEDRESVVTALASVLAGGEVDLPLHIRTSVGDVRALRLRAAPVRLEGRGAGFIASLEDTTAQRHHEEELRHAALHDPLTGLPNRAMLDQVLEVTVASRRHTDAAAALLFFDLDDFKSINDGHGHTAGDEVLVEVANRLSGTLRDDDLLARFGGDEFVVLCRQVPDVDVAVAVAERMRQRLADPIVVGDQTVHVGVSIGVAMLDDSDHGPHQLLRDADAAMYRAKRTGRDRVVVFEEEAHRAAADRTALVEELRRAIDDDELSLAWQPMSDVNDHRIVAVEALVRWHHPVRGPIAAQEIVALAEEHDLLGHLGERVLRHACEQMAHWHRSLPSLRKAKLTVNVARQQVRPELAGIVATALARTGLAPADLVLEVTEQALLADPDSSRPVLAELADLGVGIAIDDFGIGSSSVAALLEIGVRMIKVDRTVVSTLGSDARADTLLALVVGLGAALDAVVVAEGVETPSQLDAVTASGCQLAQGFLLAQPMTAAELESQLAAGGP